MVEKNYVTCEQALSDLPSLDNDFDFDLNLARDYICEPQSQYQKVMRQNSIKAYNHYPIRHAAKTVYNISRVPDGGTVYNTATIINEVGKQYGYDFKAKGTILAGLYGSSGITAVDKNLPFVLCTSAASNAGYGNHLMAGCGYKVYSKTSGWWIFKVTSYKYFYELRDGHSSDIRYLDLSALTGFGGIVLLDYKLFY